MASKRRLKRTQCGRKHRYAKDAAVRVATQMRRDHPGQSFDAYECPHGPHWHVGHRPHKVQQAISARRRLEEK